MGLSLDSIVGGITDGASVTIETVVSPPLKVSLATDAPSSPLTAFLKPRVVIERDGDVIGTYAPYGDPGPTRVVVLAGALLALVFFIFWRVAK